ncbi:PREDICTED: epididymal-specific lipocalin-9 [Chinchilla lanigera]|uniref:epididymal-specific lipocalin-9 n=1 Tax=Chinchilla lanigera TaxID=34839 RepID=UPI00038EDFC5|nr:PREDICTED: epididymal-specific lipocalin-9 [Chinchilla lanigera]
MALLLLCLVLSLALAQEFNPREIVYTNFNLARVEGPWFLISLASNNMTRIRVNGDLHLFIRSIELLENGSLMFNFRFMLHGECVIVTVTCKKTQRNGEFSIVYEGENKVLILETDYWGYIIFYLQNVRDSAETQVLALYGRIPVLDRPFLERFKRACSKYGMGPRNTIDVAEKDLCI